MIARYFPPCTGNHMVEAKTAASQKQHGLAYGGAAALRCRSIPILSYSGALLNKEEYAQTGRKERYRNRFGNPVTNIMENKTNGTNFTSALAKNTLDQIPQPKSDAREIVGLVKHSGKIDGYQLSDGSTVSKEEGVRMAKDGEIKGVGVAHRGDTEYLKSIPDSSDNNNLGNLPSISG